MSVPEEEVDVPQSQNVALPKRWPIVSDLQIRSSDIPIAWGGRMANAYAEYDKADKAWWVYKRGGLSPIPFSTSSGPSTGLGCYCYGSAASGSQSISVFGTTVYATSLNLALNGFTTVSIGTVDGTAPYFFETINSSPQTVVLGNGIKAYIFTPFANTLVQITDANFPTNFLPGWVYLDGFLYIMDALGKIWGTAGQNNAAVWSGTNVISASANADLGTGLVKQLNYVIAIKQWTSQVFYDAGNAVGSPLSVVPDAQLPFGGFAGSSIQAIDNTILYLTSNQTISPQIVQMDNLSPHIVSTPSVEKLLDKASFTSFNAVNSLVNPGIIAWIWKHDGHRFYGLTIVVLSLTLVYDIDQKLWYLWTDQNGNYWPISSISYFPPRINVALGNPMTPGLHLAQHYSNGAVYILDSANIYPTDIGNIVPVDIYTRNFDAETVRRKHLNTLYLDGSLG
jgi:hypothetical protein